MTKRLPAAVLQQVAAPSMSDRYSHISTKEVIVNLESEGWIVDRAIAAEHRGGLQDFARHRVHFRHEDGYMLSGGVVPELVVINSHDGTMSAKAMMGLYREDSSTTLLLGGPEFAAAARHSIDAEEALIQDALALGTKFHAVESTIDDWKSTLLPTDVRDEFAALAAQLRYGDAWMYPTQALLAARRAADDHDTLWHTLIRLQENMTMGGFKGRSVRGQQVQALPLTGIERDAKFNATLWQLAGEYYDEV